MERGTRIAGKYDMQERLGRGGMGEVWSARDRDLHRNVAVKLLVRDDAAPDLLHRFEREAIAAAQINHPNVVSLYDRGVHDGLQFLVMEHVDGTTLTRHIREHAPLPPAQALEIAQEICAALVAAHLAEVVHYDIKPSNIMLTRDGRVKVVDFGIAGFTHSHTFTVVPTSALPPVGTALYGAPEQFLEERGDHRSDLYALGGVLFALLTGETPFGEGGALSVVHRKLNEEPRRLRDLRPDIPEPVAALVAHLLQRDPERRPVSASAVYERVERLRSAAATDTTRGEAAVERLVPPTVHRVVTARLPEPYGTAAAGAGAGGDDAFEATWTGREPLSSYVTYRRPPPRTWHWLAFSALTVAALGLLIPMTFMWLDQGRLNSDGEVLAWLAVPTLPLTALYGHWLIRRTRAWLRHRRSVPHTGPWSLRIDADGITTTDPRRATPSGGPAGRRTYAWSRVGTCRLGYVTEFPGGPRYSALQIEYRAGSRPAGFSPPAGPGHHRPPRLRNELRPLCVLGPLSESQHHALVTALARHSGGRWDPEPGA
ncbi:protein kinase [Streptomyces sp. NPDC004134]|uniref:protein kinase domain-containing protein n=1 Tax=Streptomyces sp. NPDC004134 TaxID=3364691 RepID=UPI0036BBD4B2